MYGSERTVGRQAVILALLTTLLLLPSMALGDFTIDWYTIDSGGAMDATGGSFELSGTIGQPDASATPMTGGLYQLSGGFWFSAPVCTCLSDVNGDGERDGQDVQLFIECILGVGSDCACADVDGQSGLDMNDVAVFVQDLLDGTPCSV